tara:strand:+ start:185 stop:562 length:378 start_codon:yes stop_codon:yes gene_type:complete
MIKKNSSLEKIKDEKKQSRASKVNKLIQKTLAEIFLSKNFTGPTGESFLLFISGVKVSSDARLALVSVSCFSNKKSVNEESILTALGDNLSKIKKEFSEKIELRFTPKLEFKVDNLKGIYKNVES